MQKNIFSVLNQQDSEGESQKEPDNQQNNEKLKRDRKSNDFSYRVIEGQGKKNDEPQIAAEVVHKENIHHERNQDGIYNIVYPAAQKPKGVSE